MLPSIFVPADEGHNRRRSEPGYAYIVRHLDLLHPRLRLEVFRAAPRVLPGFTKSDAGSAYVEKLFAEALLAAATGAGATELVVLVQTLTGAEGGAATG